MLERLKGLETFSSQKFQCLSTLSGQNKPCPRSAVEKQQPSRGASSILLLYMGTYVLPKTVYAIHVQGLARFDPYKSVNE